MMWDDGRLVETALSGDIAAFGELICRHRDEATRLARLVLGDPWDAEDVVQEACLQAFLGLRDLRSPNRFGAWLLGIVVNLCRMHLRGRRDNTTADLHGGGVIGDFTWADMQPSPEEVYEARELLRVIMAAITALPTGQREAVWFHYIDGLTLQEIGRLVGVPVGTVKARLHRARAHLRRELADLGPQPRVSAAPEEEAAMEVVVHDVMVRTPRGKEIKWLAGHGEEGPQRTRVVLLKERTGERILPIWVGVAEGDALAMQLAAVATPRPLTFDLTARLMELTGATVERVAISRVLESTYYATLTVRVGDRVYEVDARPSDALNLALRVGASVSLTTELLEQVGGWLVSPDKVPAALERGYGRLTREEAKTDEMEWRSFRTLPRGSLLSPPHLGPPSSSTDIP